MDGTLIDSEPLWIAAEQEMLARYGFEMTDLLHEQLIGSGLTAAAQRFREIGVPLSVEQILDEWVRRVGEGIAQGRVEWRPGARGLLSSLAQAGIPCALVTMSLRPLADRIVALLPEGPFAAIVAGDEVEHEKPHPEPYLLGAAALGVPIERCLAIEDSPTGLRSARSSGAIAIGVPNLLDLADLADQPADEIWPTLEGLDAAVLSERFARLRGSGRVSWSGSLDLRP
jgi:HAD superfamily hydrolase (TIGR01509 family)